MQNKFRKNLETFINQKQQKNVISEKRRIKAKRIDRKRTIDQNEIDKINQNGRI